LISFLRVFRHSPSRLVFRGSRHPTSAFFSNGNLTVLALTIPWASLIPSPSRLRVAGRWCCIVSCFFLFFSFVTLFFTGQAPVLFQMPEPIDEATPKEAHGRTGFDGNVYDLVLVFSDEFEVEERTFWPSEFCSFFRFLCFFIFIFIRRHDHSMRPRPAYRLWVFTLVPIASYPNLCSPFFFSRASSFGYPGLCPCDRCDFYLFSFSAWGEL